MSVFDIEELLKEVDPDTTVGADLEFDPGFLEMEALASMGSDHSIIEGADSVADKTPDWKSVRKSALNLLPRSKDLRIAIYLARSSVVCDGLAGFSDSLLLLRRLLEQYWEQIHPQLDPEDNNDPTMRINIIAALCEKSETLELVMAAPLVSSKKAGEFSYRDVQVASGERKPLPDEQSVPTMELISAACLDCELETLQATGAAISECLEQVKAIDQALTEKVGSSQAPNFQPLTATLTSLHKFASEQLAKRGVSGTESTTGADPATEHAGAEIADQKISGEIFSRADAMNMMDKISAYYLAHEPSSPIPLLMGRAKRLAALDFLGIVKELAPGGLSQVENITGAGSGGDE